MATWKVTVAVQDAPNKWHDEIHQVEANDHFTAIEWVKLCKADSNQQYFVREATNVGSMVNTRTNRQNLWIFRDRKTLRVFTDCVADSFDGLLALASKKYGRTIEQWADHPDVEAVCFYLDTAKGSVKSSAEFKWEKK